MSTAEILTDLPGGQGALDTQSWITAGDINTAQVSNTAIPRHHPPERADLPGGQGRHVTQRSLAAGEQTPYYMLRFHAEIVDDLERSRIANENRLRQLTRSAEDSDGIQRGFGLPEDHPDVTRLANLVDGLASLESHAILNLKRAMRAHPLGAWVKATKGVGEKQGARLIAAIGDPAWHSLHSRPRTLSELRSYCGLRGDQPTTHQRGVVSNWNDTAKMRLFLVAAQSMKTQEKTPLRLVYDTGREKYADAIHVTDCKRCGPSGKPAPAGSPLSDGHKHARALRLVMEAVLRELWLAAQTSPPDMPLASNQSLSAGGDHTSSRVIPDAESHFKGTREDQTSPPANRLAINQPRGAGGEAL